MLFKLMGISSPPWKLKKCSLCLELQLRTRFLHTFQRKWMSVQKFNPVNIINLKFNVMEMYLRTPFIHKPGQDPFLFLPHFLKSHSKKFHLSSFVANHFQNPFEHVSSSSLTPFYFIRYKVTHFFQVFHPQL